MKQNPEHVNSGAMSAHLFLYKAMLELRWLDIGFSLHPRRLYVRFMMDEMVLRCSFFSSWMLVIIPPLLLTHLSLAPEMRDSTDQAELCHIFCM
jgi:hypothetical protein